VDAKGTLSVDARKRLETCEAVIAQGLRTFYEVGSALLEIRQNRLYRETHETFESYCRERWAMPQQSATRLIRAAETVNNLKSEPIGSVPNHESQVRPLTALSAEQQREAWARATATTPNPTAAQVQVAVASLANGETQSVSKDDRVTISLGTVICQMSPEDALYSIGYDYERQVCNLIEGRAETVDEIQALIAYLSTDLDLRKASIRDYFNNKKAASDVHSEAAT
jgi:hypothetical protein